METDLKNVKVLLVDDNQHTLRLVSTILHGMGISQIFTAKDGRDALNFLDEAGELVNFVICDWNMPRMTGLELLKEVKKTLPELPFLMITARATAESVKAARESGVDAYVAKPFSPQQLEKKVLSLIHRFPAVAA